MGKTARDKRCFFTCPKCKSEEINYIGISECISQYIGFKRISFTEVKRKDKGITVCSKCGYKRGSI